MQLQKVSFLNSKKDYILFFVITIFIFSFSLLIEYNNYKNFTQFDSNIVTATVIKHYTKTKYTKKRKLKTYQVLKLQTHKNITFYTTSNKSFSNLKGKRITLKVFISKLTFFQYLTTFYAYSNILNIEDHLNSKQKINNFITSQHKDKNIGEIYLALFTATPLPSNLQNYFSYLGISHLLAISGFHLGVLSSVLFFLFKFPYQYLQSRYFPYRSYSIDSFIFIATMLLCYLLFLDSPPSLLRAYFMLIIGYLLYNRGYEIISMQILILSTILLIAIFPKLFFSIGFWLSIAGVYYIFLFLIYFKNLKKRTQFFLLPLWVYIMMLPYSLVIFSNFSIYHPFSIILTSIFTLFYPISIFLHILSLGDLLDNLLKYLLQLKVIHINLSLSNYLLFSYIALSLLPILKKGKLT